MKKILISILLLTASTFIYSQSMNLNNNKIRIVDNTMGLGITPTSRLHVFGNGTASGLLNITNDKDATKDSSVIVKADGRVILGDSSWYLLNEYVSDSRLTIVGGPPLRLLNNAPFGYISLKFSALTDEDTIADYAQIMGGVMRNTFNKNCGDLSFATKGFDGLSTRMYIDSSGYVGIGTTTPKDYLDINGNITFPKNQYIFWNAYNKDGNIYQREEDYSVLMYQNTYSPNYKLFNIDVTAFDTHRDIPVVGQRSALSIGYNAEVSIYEEKMYRDSLVDYKKGTTLSDNELYAFPPNLSWKGEIDVDSLGYTLFTAQIRCDADGTPYLEGVSWKRWSSKTYVELGSTDGYLNITRLENGMVITNRLGYTINATLRFRTKQ